MSRGRFARAGSAARARRLVRFLLPVCLIAAAAVAGQGLLRVMSTHATQPLAHDQPALSLGASASGSGGATAAAVRPKPLAAPAAPSPPAPAPAQRLTQPVVVFNAGAVPGLATRTASMLRRHGVTVVGIGNFASPQKPTTPTVFYPPGESDAAQALASLSAARAVAPAPQWLQAPGKLVLVVTDSTPR